MRLTLECSIDVSVVSKSVVRATYFVVDVLAKLSRISIIRVTHFKTELSWTDEINPFNNLNICLVVGEVSWFGKILERRRCHPKAISKHNTAKRVSLFISTVRIQLSWYIILQNFISWVDYTAYLPTLVRSLQPNFGLVNKTYNLEIVFCIKPLSTGNCAWRYDTSAMARRGAPGYFTGFGLPCEIV